MLPPPGSSYYGTGQVDHHPSNPLGSGGSHHSPSKYGHHGSHHQENGHDNFSDFVTLVCQQDAGQHLAASAAAISAGHPGPVRSPYSSSGYLPPTLPPTSLAHASRPMSNLRANGKFYFLNRLCHTRTTTSSSDKISGRL